MLRFSQGLFGKHNRVFAFSLGEGDGDCPASDRRDPFGGCQTWRRLAAGLEFDWEF